MPTAHLLAKQPELVRHSVLDAALQFVIEEGPQAVTLAAVAVRAQVSPEDLQGHFSSRQALLDTLFDCLFQDFEGQLQEAIEAEEDLPGGQARAYVRLTFNGMGDTPTQRALMLLGLNWPPYAARWREACAAALVGDGSGRDSANRRLLCRLAADGLWCSQVFGCYALDETRQAEMLELLLSLCSEESPLAA
ncbi:TetR/AcrR family transcriptional regulator [Polaromonas sp. YR568]|uniref:TetR/AcrR family transcriptional regulator n=1 Tax=Polaromonas sp. YR568 TaxID=1855301 RepID=UPI0015871CB5|nr:TetR/AcrR family transcriptional regulator [Polaromonas sp. YR568]